MDTVSKTVGLRGVWENVALTVPLSVLAGLSLGFINDFNVLTNAFIGAAGKACADSLCPVPGLSKTSRVLLALEAGVFTGIGAAMLHS